MSLRTVAPLTNKQVDALTLPAPPHHPAGLAPSGWLGAHRVGTVLWMLRPGNLAKLHQ
jgi:hypothetical protein